MQKNATISEMNYVIGVFDGKSFSGSHITDYTADSAPRMKYHYDWNQLMRAWKRAAKIIFDIRGQLSQDDYLEAHKVTKSFIDACQRVEIDKAHEAVYRAILGINYYNENQQKQNDE